MSMFSTDNRRENELSRVVARLLNGDAFLEPEQYATGIPALLLTYGGNPALIPWERIRSAYARFEKACDAEKRFAILHNLAAFAAQMKGQPLSVWEPVFRCDSDFRLRSAAAHAAMTLAPRTEEDKLHGVRQMMQYIVKAEDTSLLNGAFLSCDMRFLPLIQEAWAALPENKRSLSDWGNLPPSLPALLFLTELLETSQDTDTALCGNAVALLTALPHAALTEPPLTFYHPFPDSHPDYGHPQIIDAVTPVPAWMFPDTIPQVLHTWTCPEYLPRFLPRIQHKLPEAEKTALATAWNDPATVPGR